MDSGTEVRKTVTVLFCDVTGSTSLGERLDPEAVRRVIARYFDEMAAVIGRHGGTVEKFIGDAVMAVFGIPTVHEDDALRAVRAADEMRAAVRGLNIELDRDRGVTIEIRIGVHTGPVVAGDPSTKQTFVTGDAVNVAARLEQAAAPGQILIGATTLGLVRDAVTTEPAVSLELKGKTQPVQAFPVLDVSSLPIESARRRETPLVGRKRELDALHEAFREAVVTRRCVRATVVGAPGVGKSRLIEEFEEFHRVDAVLVRGRCLSYGDGITYWPILEMVTAAAGIGASDGPDRVRGKIASLLGGGDDDGIVVERLAELLGVSGAAAAPEETHWAVRRFLEALSRKGPVAAILEDIHWAEPALLDLIEHVTTHARGASIALLCTTRPELLEERPDGSGSTPGTITIPLEPLTPEHSDQLIANVVGSQLPHEARSILATAEGNPLFLEQLLGMLIDEGRVRRDGDEWVVAGDLSTLSVPLTIQGVLDARLERLPSHERDVLERGSVEGRIFHRASVSALADATAPGDFDPTLEALERRDLIEPVPAPLGGGEAFRFRHALIRDAAYARLTKATRADLHERHARWLDRTAGDRLSELEEVLAYHLEQATRLRADLGPLDDAARGVAADAARRLTSSGRRASGRGDVRAAANLFDRALSLLGPGDRERPTVLVDLAETLAEMGEGTRGLELLDDARATAARIGDRALEIRAGLARTMIRYQNDPEGTADEFASLATEGIPILESLGDDSTLARAWKGRGEVALMRADPVGMTEAYERAGDHAERAGDRAALADALGWLSLIVMWDMTPPEEGIGRARGLRDRLPDDQAVEALTVMSEGYSLAMLGHADEGRARHRRGHDLLEDLGLRIKAAGMQDSASRIESLAGDLDAAERELRHGYEALASMGELGYLSTQAAMLAEVLYQRGRLDEVEELTRVSEAAAASDDLISQVQWRGVRAKLLARRDEVAAAVALAEEGEAIASPTGFWDLRSESLRDLAEVYRLVGRKDDAARALQQALAIIEEKGVVPLIERVQAQLARSHFG